MTEYYSTIDAARVTGLDRTMIQFYIRIGRIPAHKWMGVYRITPADLDAFMTARSQAKTRCRNGHDLTLPDAIRLVGRNRERRCRACIAGIMRRRYLRRNGGNEELMLAERYPNLFKRLADETRFLEPFERLAAGLRFWGQCA